MNFKLTERTPLRHSEKHDINIITNRWILAIVASCSGLILLGVFAHWHHMSQHHHSAHHFDYHAGAIPHHKVVTSQLHPETKVPRLHGFAARRPTPKDTADSFRKCNPAVQGRLPIVFEKQECRSQQAAIIHLMLRNEGYSFDAIIPKPYIYPANILATLLAMDSRQLRTALENLEALAEKLGALGTLVKLFAWGLPVTMHEMETFSSYHAIGGNNGVFSALQACGIVVHCDEYPGVIRSSVQLFPLQQPSIVVATDWRLAEDFFQDDMTERPIQAVDVHDTFLVMNTPKFPQGDQTKVLNMASGSGVVGLAAAARGASVVLLDTNPRAANFGRFNSWLNLLSERVRVSIHATAHLLQGEDFALILAHPSGEGVGNIIQRVLETTRNSTGMAVMSLEGQNCDGFTKRYNSDFCGEAVENHADLSGSVVCRHPHGLESDEAAHESMVFAWKGPVEDASTKSLDEMDKCGHFKTVHLKSFMNANVQACKFGRQDMLCPDASDFSADDGRQ